MIKPDIHTIECYLQNVGERYFNLPSAYTERERERITVLLSECLGSCQVLDLNWQVRDLQNDREEKM